MGKVSFVKFLKGSFGKGVRFLLAFKALKNVRSSFSQDSCARGLLWGPLWALPGKDSGNAWHPAKQK